MTVEYYRSRKSRGGRWRFRIRAANRKIIAASSEGYVRFRDCQRALILSRDALLYVVPTGGPSKG